VSKSGPKQGRTPEIRDRLEVLLTAPLADLRLDLEGVDLSSAGKRRVLRIAVDKDGGVSLDDIADATRAVSRTLDESDAMGERPYTLEVSSPGVDRPLTLPRHWRRNAGRLVKVTLAEPAEPAGSVSGRIIEARDDTVLLDVDGERLEVRYDAVESARVQVEFGPGAGKGPGKGSSKGSGKGPGKSGAREA
jgi:ribosome maturation factor RimP